MTSGWNRAAYAIASARRIRPSASVLSTSTVVPLAIFRMSPGLRALPDGRFSTSGTRPTTLSGGSSSATARIAATTAAAPAMSCFISAMSAAGLSEMPPASNVTPLPTSTIAARGFFARYSSRTSRGSCTEPLPTARIARSPSFSSSLRPMT